VVDVADSVKQFKSGQASDACFASMLQDLDGAIDTSQFNQSQIRLFLGVVQLISVGFMGFAAVMFIMNMAGDRNLTLTTGKSIGVMFASTIVFAAPALVAYAVDLFTRTAPAMSMGTG
jgi:hypothetical protein